MNTSSKVYLVNQMLKKIFSVFLIFALFASVTVPVAAQTSQNDLIGTGYGDQLIIPSVGINDDTVSPQALPVAGFVWLGTGMVSEGLYNALLALLGVSTAAALLAELESENLAGIIINEESHDANSEEARRVLAAAEAQANAALTEAEQKNVKAYFPSYIDPETNNVMIVPNGLSFSDASVALWYTDLFTISPAYAQRLTDYTSPIRESRHDDPHIGEGKKSEQYFPHYHALKTDPRQNGKKVSIGTHCWYRG